MNINRLIHMFVLQLNIVKKKYVYDFMYMYITWSGFLKQTLVQKSSYLEP